MKLTEKDKTFLERLRQELDEKQLRIDLVRNGYSRLVLRQNYGDRIETVFGLSRQGVRWRFQRIFSEIYISAYETILWVESHFGKELRPQAMLIAKERAELRQKARNMGISEMSRRQTSEQPCQKQQQEL